MWGIAVFLVYYVKSYFGYNDENPPEILAKSVVALIPVALAIYFNHYLLIPDYLFKKQGGTYAILISIVVAIISLLDYVNPYSLFAQSYLESLVLHSLIIGALMAVYTTRQVSEEQKRGYQLTIKQSETEMQLLRNQMNPHFLFNILNSIYSYALEGSEKTPDLIIKLAQLTRYQLESSRKNDLPLEDELNFVANFLILQQTRFGDRCDIDLDIHGEPSGFTIAPLLLITFVENAFKHGVATTSGDSYVYVTAEIKDGNFKFVVINPIPMVKEKEVESTWTGLANTRRRLQLRYPGNHFLDIMKQNYTYKATLFIKLKGD
jgi:LytS/YehU family sensor histidine kinase